MVRAALEIAACSFLIALAAALGPSNAHAAADKPAEAQVAEYQLKAAYLYNFARFVEWPDSAFASDDTEIIIGILQPDPFGAAIDSILAGREVSGRPIRIERYEEVARAPRCHILFVPEGEEARIPDSLLEEESPTLVVGEAPDFARGLGMVGFFEESERLRFEINPLMTRKHGLRINSKLLNLAVLVSEDDQ